MYKFFIYFPLIILTSLVLNLHAFPQIASSPEAEYSRIRDMALNGNFVEAETAAVALLDSFPAYGDAWILLARIYGWQEKYEPARLILDSLIMKEPANTDAIEARLDLALWTRENDLAIELADRILASDPSNTSIIDKKQRAEKALETPDSIRTEIPSSIDSLSINQPGTIGARDLEKTGKTDLRAGYYFDTFSEPYNRFWQVFQAGASHLLSFGRIIGGINIGNLHTKTYGESTKATEIQFEAQAYPIISTNDYAWLAYAYSPGRYFPAHRINAEYWHSFKYGWVASAGMHYYYFNRNIFIGTISVEKYYKSWWFSPRIYLYFKDIGVTTSFYLTARKYFNDINWLQLTTGYGTAPDEPFDIATDLDRQNAFSVRLAYYTSITDDIFLRAGVGYSREEYSASLQRNRFEGSLNLIYVLNKRK
jgi:YaiO family outer membrane protein